MNRELGGFEVFDRRQMQQIASALSDGVILIEVGQAIAWANEAALAMHGVQRIEQLGRTIDEYHANFRVRFWHAAAPAPEIAQVSTGRAYRDVVVEITPPGCEKSRCVHRVRNLVLTDEQDGPVGIALVLSPLSHGLSQDGRFLSSVHAMSRPAAVVRARDRVVVEVNPAFATLTGLTAPQVLGHPVSEFEFLEGCVEGELADSRGSRAVLVPNAEGASRQVVVERQPVVVGDQDCVLVTLLPVEAEWAVGAALDGAMAPAVTAGIVGAAVPLPLYVLDEARNVAAVSEAWLAWLGYAEPEVVGRGIAEFMAPASGAHLSDHFWRALDDVGSALDASCQFRAKSGELRAARVEARGLGAAPNRRFVCAVTDLTASRRSEASFAALFGLSPLPAVVRKLQDGRILDANPAFFAVTGQTEAAVIGHAFEELANFPTTTARHRFDAELRTGQTVQRTDVQLRTQAGGTLECQVSATVIHAFDQPCAILVLQDVTERRRDEKQLFQAIESVMKDSDWFSRSVVEKLAGIRSPSVATGRDTELNDLTKREREVLAMISHGWSDTEISERLGLTRSTVRNHVAALYGKIGVHNRSSAIVWARERALNVTFPAASFAPSRRALRAAAE